MSHKEYGMTQKGLDAIDRIIKESPQYKELIEEFLKRIGGLHTEIIRQIQVVHIDKGRVWRAEDYYDLNEAFDKIKGEYKEKK